MRHLVPLAAAIVLAVAPMAVNAVPVSAGAAVSVAGHTLVSGLEGRFADTVLVSNPAELSAGLAVADSATPTATFRSTLIDYPNGGLDYVGDLVSTLSGFLGADAASLSGAGGTNLEGSVFVFKGLIRIDQAFDLNPGTSAIDVNFNVGSDDGFRLFIGGNLVGDFFGLRPFDFTPMTAAFEAAGFYDIRLEFWENGGGSGIEFYSSIPGGPDSGAPAGTVGIVPTAVLVTIPEPATLALIAVALAGLAFRRRVPGGASPQAAR